MKFAHLLLFLATLSAACYAQDTTATPPAAPAAVSPSKPKPAQAPPSTEKKKPKKVWTNEDLGSVKGSVSVVGDQNSDEERDAQKAYVASGNENVRQRRIAMVRNQIQQLQGQMDAIDKRIAQLHNFKGENTSPSGGINPSQGYNMVPLQEQVKQLEDRKKQIQTQIQDLEADAKKNGIEPGDLR